MPSCSVNVVLYCTELPFILFSFIFYRCALGYLWSPFDRFSDIDIPLPSFSTSSASS